MSHMAWHDAWFQANSAFYTRNQAEDHFTTSVNADAQVANALATMINQQHERHRDRGLVVVDVGSGSGRLLEQLRKRTADEIHLLGVDVRARPSELPTSIHWRQVHINDDASDFMGHLDDTATVVIAHEFLDDIPCEVFEWGEDSDPHVVLVDPATGAEELGPRLDDQAVVPLLDPIHPDQVRTWLDTWWPATRPGARRETGLTRQRIWSTLITNVQVGCAVAIDYAHTRADRMEGVWDGGTIKGFRSGRPQRAVPDGSVNISAHVALDALAGPTARLITQDRVLERSTLSSWPIGLGSFTWLIEQIGEDFARPLDMER